MFFRFPEDARWNEDGQAVEFGIGIGDYEGIVRVGRRVFQRLIDGRITPESCIEAYHLNRTRFERIAERKLRCRQISSDGNLDIDGRDLREGEAEPPAPSTASSPTGTRPPRRPPNRKSVGAAGRPRRRRSRHPPGP